MTEGPSPKARVLHFSTVHKAGDPRIFLKECASLARAGYQVSYLCHDSPQGFERGVARLSLGPRVSGNPWRMLKRVVRAARRVIPFKAEIYHFHDPELLPLGVLLSLLGRVVVYDVHEDFPRQWTSNFTRSRRLPGFLLRPLPRILEIFEHLCVGRFSALVSVTPDITNRLVPRARRCRMVRNFPLREEIDSMLPRPWREKEEALAYVGGITEARGSGEMVSALHILASRRPLRLLLGGDFSPPQARSRLEALPGWSHVEYLGFLNREGLKKTLARAKVGWCLIHSEPRYQVAYPVKLFEYMAAGIPCVVSNFPLWRDIVEGADCGLLADPLDPSDIAEKTAWLLDHPKESEAMGLRGRKAVENLYAWDTEEKTLLDLYGELLS